MSDSLSDFPMMDRQISLPSGRTARVRNTTVFSGNAGKHLQLMMQAEPSYDSTEVTRQAIELANMFDGFATDNSIDHIIITVCVTPHCLAFRERPELLFMLGREADRWVIQPGVV
jgi:hypothetical protein